ncbi:glycosyltransferase family 2 protein [Hydrogenophaga sp.]|uniref:glycosyltransferase family 2 protein n=1 Tax=Hydrogenophaga sp. TaxID=1904254 RepID=UPI003F726B30
MNTSKSQTLTWAWCIATYQRHAVLRRALATVVAQSRLPSELIVVDASPNWEEGRALLTSDFERYRSEMGFEMRLEYVQGTRASSAAQRNQGIELASADVLFLIDDDTLLYPDCAEKLMEVYERDSAGVVQAVIPSHVKTPPDAAFDGSDAAELAGLPTQGAVAQYHPFVGAVRRWLKADDRFVPYDADFPQHVIPVELSDLPLSLRNLAAGYCLTCRRSAALREKFEGRLERYCPGEDSDFTYRMTRTGPILARHDAQICHLEAGTGRMASFPKTALGAINPLLLHRIHSSDRRRSLVLNRQLLLRRLVIEALKDLRNRDWSLPQARGIYAALAASKSIFSCPDEEFDRLFHSYQRQFTQPRVNVKRQGP